MPGGRREENYTKHVNFSGFSARTGRPGAHTTAMPSDLGPRDDIAEVEAKGISLLLQDSRNCSLEHSSILLSLRQRDIPLASEIPPRQK